jgi:hypothetical protein
MTDLRTWIYGVVLLFSPVLGAAAQGLPPADARSSAKPDISGELTFQKDLDWSPLLSRKERLPMPALRDVFDGIKRGGAENFEKAIRTAYQLVAAYAHNEGHEITFELSGFETVSVPDALRLKYGDITSIGLRDQLSISGITREDTLQDGPRTIGKAVRRGYDMKWEVAPSDPDRELWAKRSVAEYIEIARADLPALSLLRAVTSYRVSVTFEGIHRDYRASFLWMGAAAGSAITTFQCLEPVANRVGLVLAEQIPPEGKQEDGFEGKPLARGASTLEKPGFKLLPGPVCNVYTAYPYTPTWEQYGSERHVSSQNWHHSASFINVSCSCGSACQSVCHPSVGLNLCQDSGGTVTGFHVPAIDQKLTATTVQNALYAAGANCEGTLACAFSQCQVPNCAFSIVLNPSSPGFTSNPANATFWGLSPTSKVACDGCTEYEKPTPPEIPKEDCPVLIALDEQRLELTDLARGVRFDLNRNGAAERLSWPAPGSSWSFVALDLNRNGRIDDGGELFGNYTMQPLGGEPNGYKALAVYDDPINGGNGDGVLDAKDRIFSSLLLWIDADHDGVSQSGELMPLAQRVDSIGLDYKESRARDRYGNQFRYRGTVQLTGGSRSRSVDVFLLSD